MRAILQVCPTCKGDGSGWVPFKSFTGGSGMCPDCRGEGEVTQAKRERLLEAKA